MNEESARWHVHHDPQFVFAKRYEYSITKLEERYPDGCPDNVIASALMIREDQVEVAYESLVEKMRTLMGVET